MNGTEVVAATGDAAFAVDREGRIVAWNGAAERCLGYRRTEILGQRCWKVLKGRSPGSGRLCDRNCPARLLRREPVHRDQMFLRPINRVPAVLRAASGEATRSSLSTLVVQGEAGEREIVHLF